MLARRPAWRHTADFRGQTTRSVRNGHLRTNQHSTFSDPFTRLPFARQEVTSGFSGTFSGDRAEVFGPVPVGIRSLSFQATPKHLADV